MHRIAGNFWIFLLAGFASACLLGGIAIWMSSGSALKRFQEHTLTGHSKEIAATVESRIRDHVNAFQFLARRPRILGAILGEETELENVRDVLRTFDLYDDVVQVELFDVLGDRMISMRMGPWHDALPMLEPERRKKEVEAILSRDGEDTFQIVHHPDESSDYIYSFVPVLRDNGTEGVLVGVFKMDLDQFLAIDNQLLALSFAAVDANRSSRGDVHRNSAEVAELGLNLNFTWSLELLRKERATVVRSVAGSLFLGLGIAFIALAWFGRRIILGPQRELELSRSELAESESKARELAAIAENSLDPININDLTGRLIWANDAFYRKWGYDPEEFVGRRPMEVLTANKSRVEDVRSAYRDSKAHTGEVSVYTRDGTPVDLLISMQPLADKDGQPTRMLVITRDVTELKRREAELEQARKKAEAASHAKSNFLANMSHEIRTPMNGIIGMCELLNETELNAEQRLCATTINDSSTALLTIINNILDFSKIEAGKEEIQSNPFSLSQTVNEVALLLYPLAQEKNVDLCVDYSDALPTEFLGDIGRVRQILLNLAGNAVKFTETGHVLIRVLPSADSKSQHVTIIVQDTGIGIPQSKISSVFQAFEQADNEQTRRYDGTGLGLAITKKLVTMMNGSIELHSEVGRGSEFTLHLAMEPCPDASAVMSASASLVGGKRILVADDLDVNRQILRDRFEAFGAEVTLAASGEEALDLVLAQADGSANGFDMGVFDYQMPDMKGDMLMAAMRGRQGVPMFPALLCCSMDHSLDSQRLADLGFVGILAKPVTRDRICAAIDQALRDEKTVLIGDHPHDASDVAADGGSAPKEVHRVLIAEDNRTNILVLKKMLASFSVEPVICMNGQEVVDTYISGAADLIFMDMSMPVMGGLEATSLIRNHETERGLPECPIVALTAKAMKQHEQECLDAGMTGYLSKPVRKSELTEALSKHGITSTAPAKRQMRA